MPFPPSTQRWGRDLADKIRDIACADDPHRGRSPILQPDSGTAGVLRTWWHSTAPSGFPRSLTADERKKAATAMYYGLTFRYGFEDALRTGNWMPWPEDTRETTCHSQASINFAIAQQLGLDPMLVEFIGLQEEGHTHRAGHSLVVVNVGESNKPLYWVVDQAMRMYGPLTMDERSMVVENLGEQPPLPGMPHRADFRIRRYDFIQNIACDEERAVARIHTLQENPETVLYQGQRIAVAPLDSWQSKEPVRTTWYIKFLPREPEKEHSHDTVVSRIIMERPGIKSRGLEFQLALDKDRSVVAERFVGYYCTGIVWSDFTDPVPMVDLPVDAARALAKRVKDIPLAERSQFERDAMTENDSTSAIREAARISYDALRKTEYGAIVWALSAVEALYQKELTAKNPYLRPAERDDALKRLQHAHPFFGQYVAAKKRLEETRKTKRKLEKRPDRLDVERLRTILDPSQREDPRTAAFLMLRTAEERLANIMESSPTYIFDAIDRLVFYDRRIKGKERKVQELVQEAFGPEYEPAVFNGYARIFTEFLGHLSVAQEALFLDRYKENILAKLSKR